MALERLNYDHWRFVAETGAAMAQVGRDWPRLDASPLCAALRGGSHGLAAVDALISESFLDVLQRLRPRRDRRFVEMGSDVNILAARFDAYLDHRGRYLLLHPDPEVVRWVTATFAMSGRRIQAATFDDVLDPSRSDLVAALREADYVFDRQRFVLSAGDPSSRNQAVEKAWSIAAAGKAMFYSLAPLAEHAPQHVQDDLEWRDQSLSPLGEALRIGVPTGQADTPYAYFDRASLKAVADNSTVRIRQISRPMNAVKWSVSRDAACARLLYRVAAEAPVAAS